MMLENDIPVIIWNSIITINKIPKCKQDKRRTCLHETRMGKCKELFMAWAEVSISRYYATIPNNYTTYHGQTTDTILINYTYINILQSHKTSIRLYLESLRHILGIREGYKGLEREIFTLGRVVWGRVVFGASCCCCCCW